MKDYVYWATEKSKCSLKHYGVKGMRWGVRRTPEQLGHRKISKGTGTGLSAADVAAVVDGKNGGYNDGFGFGGGRPDLAITR